MEKYSGIFLILGVVLTIFFYKSFPGKSGGYQGGYAAFMTVVVLLIIAFIVRQFS